MQENFFLVYSIFLHEMFKFIDPVSSLDCCNITDSSVRVLTASVV